MNKAYFNFNYNKCFCFHCYSRTKIDYFTVANSNYTVPRGWTRFGLQIDQTFAESKQIFKKWCTSFYGTSKYKLESIINNRFIPFPGDRLLSGEIFATHLSDKQHVYTSPSINYASLTHVCPIDTTKINNEWYDVQIVLECKQNPQKIVKQQGYRRNVCRIISDNEIEWKTDQRSSIIPYGLLIRARKHQCIKECVHRHSSKAVANASYSSKFEPNPLPIFDSLIDKSDVYVERRADIVERDASIGKHRTTPRRTHRLDISIRDRSHR
ncbi:unnamed protein product, partial [Rotaria sp. Silwood2]